MGRATIAGGAMHKQRNPQVPARAVSKDPRGEFDTLLREIEKETVPERLLELALKLQEALGERRRLHRQEESVSDDRRSYGKGGFPA